MPLSQPMPDGFAAKIAALNNFEPATAGFSPFIIAGEPLGWLGPETADLLQAQGFIQPHDAGHALVPGFDTDAARRSEGLRLAAEAMQADGRMGGFRDEPYRVCAGWDQPDMAALDRRAIPHFGIRSFGIHLNGVVETATGLEMWIARRALDREVEPGKRDNMVAGGQPAGLSLMDNLIKEAAEEAAVPEALARQAKQGGIITYQQVEPVERLKHDTIFTYDLFLSEDFVPENTDGEVGQFERLPIADVAAIVRDTDEFKPNCNLVIIEFLARHGLLEVVA